MHDLTQPQAAGARLQPAAQPPPTPPEDDISDESDFESQKSIDDIQLESNMPKHGSSFSTSDEENEEATRNVRPTRNSAEHGEAKRRLTLTTRHKPRAPRQLTASDTKWNTDLSYKHERSSFIGNKVKKLFPPHGIYEGKVDSYYHTSDTYLIKYIDGDVEVVSYTDMKALIPGTPEHQNSVANCAALHVAYTAAIIQAQYLPNLQRKEPLTYKQARPAHDAKDWIAACDLEMTKLHDLSCWEEAFQILIAQQYVFHGL